MAWWSKPASMGPLEKYRELFAATIAGDARKVEKALALGADVHAKDNEALHLAAGNGYSDVVAVLLDCGADLHARKDGALQLAARNGRRETVALLLDRGANIHALNDKALHCAAEYGHRETVALLLDRSAPTALPVRAAPAGTRIPIRGACRARGASPRWAGEQRKRLPGASPGITWANLTPVAASPTRIGNKDKYHEPGRHYSICYETFQVPMWLCIIVGN